MRNLNGYIVPILLLLSCGDQQKGYKIDGIAKGIEDGTEIFLHDPITREKIDSSVVQNERFEFSGLLTEKTKQVIIATKGWSDYKYFWLENSEVGFKAEKGKFRAATITGLELQRSYDQFLKEQEPLQKSYDSLFDISDGNFSADERKQINRLMLDLQEKITEGDKKYVRDNPGSMISAYILDVYKTTWGHSISNELFEPMQPEIKKSHYGKNIDTYLILNKDLKIGDHFVDFELPNTAGEKVKASDFSEKYLLIEFWASWCGPCRKENPELVKLYNVHRSKGFEILGVSMDTEKEAWIEAVRKDELPWQNVNNFSGEIAAPDMIYGVAAIPDNVLINPSGIIIGRNLRGEELRKQLEKIFNSLMTYGK